MFLLFEWYDYLLMPDDTSYKKLQKNFKKNVNKFKKLFLYSNFPQNPL